MAALIVLVLPVSAAAVNMHVVFSVNGDTTKTSMVQGDSLAWGTDCSIGANLIWQIWYDVNGNGSIDDPGDRLVKTYSIVDGDTLSDGRPADIDPVPDGWYFTWPILLGVAPGTYLFRVDDLSAKMQAQKAMVVTALSSPPNSFAGRLVVPGHPAPDAAMLQNRWIEANAQNEDQMWSAMTDDSGRFTINVGNSGSGMGFTIDPPDIVGYVTPAEQAVTAIGHQSLADFVYSTATDSIFGTVLDNNGLTLPIFPIITATQQGGGWTRTDDAVDGTYKFYFTTAERGVWWIGVSPQSVMPQYMVPIGHAVDNSSVHGIQHNIVCPKADSTVYIRVTENGGLPTHHYRAQVTQGVTGDYMSVVTGIGASNTVPAPVSHVWDTGWYAMIIPGDSAYPIPPNLVLDGSSEHSFHLGDTLTFNFVSGKMVRDTLTVDPGDPTPTWDSVWVGLCTIDDCLNAAIDQNGVFTVFADTGEYYLTAYVPGYLTSPENFPVHLLTDVTNGLDFTLNSTTCRIHGSITGVPLPLAAPAIVSASRSSGKSYVQNRPVNPTTGTYELPVCDGNWTIIPPTIAGFVTPSNANITIGELPDSARTVDFNYSATDVEDRKDDLPEEFALLQNYPNPFNPSTVISFTLPVASSYTVTIMNITGQTVATFSGKAAAGRVSVTWDAGRNSSGVYLYRLTAGDYLETKKMVLLK
ncbi:MAG: T9SS type A sorting domain-containing protein [Candidatus Zixiibacteriota bacterium]